jgi:hypothetical protein
VLALEGSETRGPTFSQGPDRTTESAHYNKASGRLVGGRGGDRDLYVWNVPNYNRNSHTIELGTLAVCLAARLALAARRSLGLILDSDEQQRC